MNTKYLFTAIGVVVVLVIALFVYNQHNKQTQPATESNNNTVNLNSNTESSTNSNDNTADANSNGNANANANSTNTNGNTNKTSNANTNTAPKPAVFEVTYNGTTFSPATINAKVGDVVIFKNSSDMSFWPASDPHPTHTNYPEFDAKQSITPGQTYQFKFTKTGSWGYHNHLNPSARGTIIVK